MEVLTTPWILSLRWLLSDLHGRCERNENYFRATDLTCVFTCQLSRRIYLLGKKKIGRFR